jgi:hypothetical protein
MHRMLGVLEALGRRDPWYSKPVRRSARHKLVLSESEAAELDDGIYGSTMIQVDKRRGPVRWSARIACRCV